MSHLNERIEELALELTRIKSVVETPGEVTVADRIHEILSGFPYFKKHPELLIKTPVKGDELGRYSIVALLRGEASDNRKTVVTLGHFDTVGTSDYGALEEIACEPLELTRRMKDISLSDEARADLESGDYLFGRGLFDMKTGDAILMTILEDLSSQPETFDGNMILMAVCDEEAASKGMLAAIPALIDLKKTYGLDYQALLDTDYMTAEYPGDPNRYIYVGTVGKLMPSFYVVGKETHVGEAFKGLDANHIAAKIVDLVDLNPAYCDVVEGEATLPPVTLKMRDLKTEYSVQTARTANVYLNYATHSSTPSEVLQKMKEAAFDAFTQVTDKLNEHYRVYCQLASRPYQRLPFTPRVLTFRELVDRVTQEKGEAFNLVLSQKLEAINVDGTLDDREKSLEIVEFVHDQWSDRDPVVIVYITPPYYPHIYVTPEDAKGRHLLEALKNVVDSTKTPHPLVFKKFFPYISDMSFGGAPTDPEVVQDLKRNMPGFGVTYELPLDAMQELNLPVFDIGPYGKDAHKYTERIETKWAFDTAPGLVLEIIHRLLK